MMAFWWRRLPAVAGLLLIFLIFLSIYGLVVALAVTLLVLATYLVRNLMQLANLDRWLRDPAGPAPSGVGEWGDVFYLLNKHLRASRHGQDVAVASMAQMLQATASLPDGVVILDRRDRIAWLNDAAERFLGLSRGRDIGQYVHYLVRSARFVEWLGLGDCAQTLRMRAPSQPDTMLKLVLVPLSGDQRMLICHDITELERVDAMRRDFVANVSHELRTPITVIAGFLEGYADMERPSPEQFAGHVGLLCEQTDRIRHLLDDLLTLARLESDQDLKSEAVDVPALVEALAGEARSLSQGRHAIEVDLATPAHLIGNGQELHSAFGNLVSNAVRYTPAGGRVTLRWALTGNGGTEFSVTDTGEGIEARHIPRLTERFYRVDRGRSRATGGTGLGLAIVKHVLQRHQGRLRIESEPGRGSTFTAVLPADRVISEAVPGAGPVPPAGAA
ncbi:MAG: phosphate regulon sensor histidine kinase PhoR [Gallionellaceae bacterium]|nr:phosphate regulon sensor histidine kinase PhoR [Gallionellaceae bacterium]